MKSEKDFMNPQKKESSYSSDSSEGDSSERLKGKNFNDRMSLEYAHLQVSD